MKEPKKEGICKLQELLAPTYCEYLRMTNFRRTREHYLSFLQDVFPGQELQKRGQKIRNVGPLRAMVLARAFMDTLDPVAGFFFWPRERCGRVLSGLAHMHM